MGVLAEDLRKSEARSRYFKEYLYETLGIDLGQNTPENPVEQLLEKVVGS